MNIPSTRHQNGKWLKISDRLMWFCVCTYIHTYVCVIKIDDDSYKKEGGYDVLVSEVIAYKNHMLIKRVRDICIRVSVPDHLLSLSVLSTKSMIHHRLHMPNVLGICRNSWCCVVISSYLRKRPHRACVCVCMTYVYVYEEKYIIFTQFSSPAYQLYNIMLGW